MKLHKDEVHLKLQIFNKTRTKVVNIKIQTS